MQVISRPAHCKVCAFRCMISMFISWIISGILAKAVANGKRQRRMKLFNPASVEAVGKTSPDSSCIVKVWGALYEGLRVFKTVNDFKPIGASKTSVVTIPDSFDLEQRTTRYRFNSGFFDGFLLKLVKEMRMQNSSIIKEPICRGPNVYLLDNDKTPETRNASSRSSSGKKTSNLTVQNGGSKTRVGCNLWNLRSSWEVIQEETPMDQSTIRSDTPFPQYHLWPLTSASEGSVKNQSNMWPIKFVQDCTVAIQSHVGFINSVQETQSQPKSKRTLQFGIPETPESGELQPFLPLVSSNTSQLGFSTTPNDEPIDELQHDLLSPIKDRQLDLEVRQARIDIKERNKRCNSPDLGFCEMDQSPPTSPSKKSCGICHTQIEKSKFFARRRYGLLSNCHHVFCYPCIHKHCMPTSTPLIESAVCPECQHKSEVIAASTVWMEGDKKAIFFKKFAAEMKGTSEQHVSNKATFLSQTKVQKNLVAICGIV